MDTTTHTAPAIVLVPGHWLGAWAWDAVAADLRDRGHHVTALTLPGLDPDAPERGSATVTQQVDALRSAVDAAAARCFAVVLVAHSGAGVPTSVLLDQDPAAVARVIYVDSGPSADGSAFNTAVPPDTEEVPLPPFDQLIASIEGLSDDDLTRFREQAVPEPGSVIRETVHLNNDARHDVPTTIIASSYPSQVMMQMARDGHPMMAEVATLRDLELVDLPHRALADVEPPHRPRGSDLERDRALTARPPVTALLHQQGGRSRSPPFGSPIRDPRPGTEPATGRRPRCRALAIAKRSFVRGCSDHESDNRPAGQVPCRRRAALRAARHLRRDLVDDLPESDMFVYRRSMKVLADLEVSVVHPGHGRSFDQVRLRELGARYLDRA